MASIMNINAMAYGMCIWMVNRLKIKMERQYFIITMHGQEQKVLITNSILKNEEHIRIIEEEIYMLYNRRYSLVVIDDEDKMDNKNDDFYGEVVNLFDAKQI